MLYRFVHLRVLTVASAAMFASPALSQPADVTILGLTFGQPLPFSECQPGPLAEKWLKNPRKYQYESPYAFPTSAPCYERLQQPFQRTPIGDETLTVKYPLSIKLALTSKRYFTVKTIAGKLSGIYMVHEGISVQSQNLQALKAKFGNPSESQDTTWQNNFGAGYTATDAVWKLPIGLTILYISRMERSDQIGQFLMYSTEQGKRDDVSDGKPKPVTQGL
ncbi:hypothetical protein SPH9361_04915 [Sphingobium sp. CECT 9361]|nr:hypothetical protein SPH9361_04915 [Sphingobium sp. CECT 9361]